MKNNTVLRFAVMSDVHYNEEYPYVRDRFKSAMENIYDYCEGEDYNNLDALYVVGDFADLGLKSQMQMFKEDCDKYVLPDTKLVVTLANHELHYVPDYKQAMADFQELFKMDFDRHEVLNGYHFISLSATIDKGPWHDSFDKPKRDFLEAELKKAVADDGSKPVFVFQHPGQFGTVLGGSFGNKELYHILSQFPQVIDFSGHSHNAVNNPREIHQKHYTSVSTGTLLNICAYDSIECAYINGCVKKSHDMAQMLLVEVDKDSKVHIKILDIISGKFFDEEYLVENVCDKRNYKYTLQRAANAPTPYFADGAEVTLSETDEGIAVSFPRAMCDGGRVFEYTVCIEDSKGIVVSQKSVASDYPLYYQADSYTITMDRVEDASSVLVYAVGFWDNYSAPIKKTKI